ncbi:MAG: MaoC family dehydratase [Bacteroidota bacterium]
MSTTNKIKVGDSYSFSFSFSQEDVKAFAEVSGDKNPIHLDADYAAQTLFKRPIMHGFLGGSVLSKIFGTMFPGEGTIYLRQNLEFLRPMFVDVEYEATVEVKEVDSDRHRGILITQIKDVEKGKVTIKGEAELMHNERF